jgi:hypothetical protein
VRRVAFCWHWRLPLTDLVEWGDGLHGALVRTGWDVTVYTIGPGWSVRTDDRLRFVAHPTDDHTVRDLSRGVYDAVLGWGSLDRPLWERLPETGIPRLGLCFAGGPVEHPNRQLFERIFVETEWYRTRFADNHRVTRAFGVDLDVFFPRPEMRRLFPAIYPASVVAHKRHYLLPAGALAVGRMEEPAYRRDDCTFLPRVTPSVLNYLYNACGCTVVCGGAFGGSERAVLESFACHRPVVVCADNERCAEFVGASGLGLVVPPNPTDVAMAVRDLYARDIPARRFRDYLLGGLTSAHYAARLLDWLG